MDVEIAYFCHQSQFICLFLCEVPDIEVPLLYANDNFPTLTIISPYAADISVELTERKDNYAGTNLDVLTPLICMYQILT